MRRTFWGSTICTKTFWGSILLAGSLCATPLLQAQQVFHQLSGDLAVTYSIERAKIASIDCGCFWLQGGSVSGAISLFHGLGIAANFTGEHAANIAPGEDLSKIAFMAGPRYTLHASHGDGWFSEKRRITVFGEALFGVQQNGLARQRFGSQPQRLREIVPRGIVFRVPAPFVFFPAAFELPEDQIRKT